MDGKVENSFYLYQTLFLLSNSHSRTTNITYELIALTVLPRDKMAAILADDIFKWIYVNKNGRIHIQISLTFIPTSPIDNKPALVLVMTGQAVNWTNDDPVNRRIYAALRGGH